MKADLHSFHDSFTREIKNDLASFKDDVSGKLNEIATDLKETRSRMGEAEERVADMEEWATNAKEALCHAMHMQESIQAKLTDFLTLFLRSRRNNIHIYGIPEGAEGDNMHDFIESFIQSELALHDTELGIQRCHRALAPKPLQSG